MTLAKGLTGAHLPLGAVVLSAEVAHEIRNPLTVMKLLSDTLAQGMAPDDPKVEDLGVMREKIAHMEGVVSRVLGMSKAQSGAFRTLDLRQAAENASLLLRLKLQQLGGDGRIPAVSRRAHHLAQHGLDVPPALHEVHGQPVQQLRVTRSMLGIHEVHRMN